VPKGSFYYYFPSKEAFALEVIAQFAAAYLARLEQYLGDCVFRSKVATDSGRNLPPIPVEGCH
jgi:AcrR family transcriptional regulator